MAEKRLNLGISILRIILCYVIVVNHFGGDTSAGTAFIREWIAPLAVPSFMFISFYLSGSNILSLKKELITNRMKRLYAPVLIWSVLYYIAFSIHYRKPVYIKELFTSLLLGGSMELNPPLWYNISQIILLLLIVALVHMSESSFILEASLTAIIMIALLLQYTGVTAWCFGDLQEAAMYTIGRSAECLPFACLGMLYRRHEPVMGIERRIGIIVVGLLLAILGRLMPPAPGFGNQGMYTFGATMVLVYIFVNIKGFYNGPVSKVINYIAGYTNGIYCMHFAIGIILADFLYAHFSFGGFSMKYCAVVFVVGLVASIIFDKLFGKIRFMRYAVK